MEIPKGHYIFGTVKVGERGQIVIPREARDKFNRYAHCTRRRKVGDRCDQIGRVAEICVGHLSEDGGRQQ